MAFVNLAARQGAGERLSGILAREFRLLAGRLLLDPRSQLTVAAIEDHQTKSRGNDPYSVKENPCRYAPEVFLQAPSFCAKGLIGREGVLWNQFPKEQMHD
jgi:hypothetical protein